MNRIKIYLAILAMANYVFVLVMIFGPHWFVYPAFITAISLFAVDVGSKRPLRMVGALFNYMGVVAGGLTDTTSVMYMALFGCQLLFTDHVSELITEMKTRSRHRSQNIPERNSPMA